MNRHFFSFFSFALGFTFTQAWATDPLAVEMRNENLDSSRLPLILVRSFQDSDECEIPTPLRSQTRTTNYRGSRNSMSLSLVDEMAPAGQIVINLCSASISGQAVQMPYFSVSESAKILRLSLHKNKRSGFILVSITTSPPDLAMVNRTLNIPLGGIPFISRGDTSSDDEL